MKKLKATGIFAAVMAAVMLASSGAAAPVIGESYSMTAYASGSVTLDKYTLSLGLGEGYALRSNTSSVAWRTSDSKILKVDQKGAVRAVGLGTAWITARTSDGTEKSCRVTVKKAPESVQLSESEVVMGKGETFGLSAVLPEGTASAERIFRCNDPDVLKMTKTNWTGEFKALKEGETRVKVILYNGVKTSIRVTVKKAPSAVSLSKDKVILGEGETCSLTSSVPEGMACTKYTYKSENTGVSTVSADKDKVAVKGVSVGRTNVSVTTYNDRRARCRVVVKPAPDKVTISRSTLTLGVGESTRLDYSIPEGTYSGSVVFRTSNSKIIRMTETNGTGKFVAVAPGTAWVTVRTHNGNESSCKITVREAPESIALTKNQVTLAPGQKYTLGSNLNSGAAAMVRTYSSSDSNVVKMTRTDWVGEFVAVEPGTAYVKVRAYNGVEDICKVTVLLPDFSFDLPDNPITLDPGSTFRITAGNDKLVSFSVENEAVATVSSTGVVKAVSPGTTDVIVTTDSGKRTRAEIIVYGEKKYCTFPAIDDVSRLLNKAKLEPVKTNCSAVDSLVDGILSKTVKSGMSNAAKAKAVYDYLAVNCSYDYGGYKAINAGNYKYDSDKDIVEFSYCILKKKIGTCENFSAAYVVLLRRLGFDAELVYGDVGMSAGGYGGHYWVDVNINGTHLSFDPQVENSNLSDSGPMHYFYGMRPELNYHMYHYDYIIPVHGFKR